MYKAKHEPASSFLGWFGILATLAYLGTITYFQWSKIQTILQLPLNNFGDFLSGVFGSLAIFWLVLGFFQQGKELKNSVATLELQARELASSVEQQRELVAVTRDALEHERSDAQRVALERKANIQPSLSIKSQDGGNFDGELYLTWFTVFNSGHSIRNVYLDFNPQALDIAGNSHVFLETNQSFSVEIKFASEWVSKENGILVINFLTVDGDAGKQSFKVSKPSGNDFWGFRFVRLS